MAKVFCSLATDGSLTSLLREFTVDFPGRMESPPIPKGPEELVTSSKMTASFFNVSEFLHACLSSLEFNIGRVRLHRRLTTIGPLQSSTRVGATTFKHRSPDTCNLRSPVAKFLLRHLRNFLGLRRPMQRAPLGIA